MPTLLLSFSFLPQSLSSGRISWLILIVIVVILGYLLLKPQEGGFRQIFSKLSQAKGGTPVLDSYSINLTAMAKAGKLDPVVDRENEITRIIQILSRRTKNNPILLGEAGIGKTAIVEGLAERIVAGNVPSSLLGKRVLALNINSIIAGTKYRGEFESRLRKVIDEIRASQRNIILFIDEIHLLIEAKGTEGALDPADILKPALARGDLQTVGATTLAEYEKYIKPEASLERRFQPIFVSEPTPEMAIEILKGVKGVYEKHHGVVITNGAIKAAAELSQKFIKERCLPDKAIDLIDEASAKVSLANLRVKTKKEKPEVKEQDIKEIIGSWVNLPIEKIE